MLCFIGFDSFLFKIDFKLAQKLSRIVAKLVKNNQKLFKISYWWNTLYSLDFYCSLKVHSVAKSVILRLLFSAHWKSVLVILKGHKIGFDSLCKLKPGQVLLPAIFAMHLTSIIVKFPIWSTSQPWYFPAVGIAMFGSLTVTSIYWNHSLPEKNAQECKNAMPVKFYFMLIFARVLVRFRFILDPFSVLGPYLAP